MRWLVLILLLLPQVGQAQPPFSIRHLTTNDGLSQGSCFYILKDSRGFMWMSSQDGLNRYDGSRFTVYNFNEQDSTTLGKGEVRGVIEDPNGDLWIGTEECLNRYRRHSDSFERVYAMDSRGKRLPALQEPFFADDSTVWYASNREGIMKLNYKTGHKTRISPWVKPKFSINTEWIIHQPDQQALLYLLPVGFARYNYRTHQLTTFLTGKSTDQPFKGLSTEPFRRAFLFQSIHRCHVPGVHYGHYCFAGPQGIFEFDAKLTHLLRYHPIRTGLGLFRLTSMDEDKQGRWWIGAEGSGVWQYDPDTMTLVREITPGPTLSNSLMTNQISAVYVDDLGLVWANGDPFGIDVIYPNAYTVETFPDDPLNVYDLNRHPIRGLCEDRQGRIWIGTVDGGIRRFDPATGLMQAYTSAQGVPTEGNVRHIFRTRDGRILVTNLQGLLRYDPFHDRFVELPNPLCSDPDCRFARGICELPDGRFVMATFGGLFILTNDLKPISRIDPDGTFFGSLHFDPATNLLYAGRRDQDLAVYRYRRNGSPTSAPRKDLLTLDYITLSGHNVMDFFVDSVRHCLWLSTDRGLVRFDPVTRRVIRTYTIRDGLPNNVVYGMLPDRKGHFWLSTNNGLVKFNPTNVTFAPVVSTKGREYNSHALLAGSDGTFYAGGVHGLDRFIPEQLETYKANVPVRIISFDVNDLPYRTNGFVGETGRVSLSHEQNTLSIGLATLDYFSNGKNQIAYTLSGIDRGWVNLKNTNVVRYADLPPGDYTFRARATDARGKLTPALQLAITIHPPYWQRWWFRLLGTLVIVGCAAIWINAYNRQKLNQQRRLLQNTLATQEDERRRIARDLHDDVGNTLAAIKGVLGLARERLGQAEQMPEVDKAYTMIDKAGNDLRTITHDLMPIEFETYALPDVVGQLVDRVNQSSRTAFAYILFGEVNRLKPERELVVYRIIAELVQNALKHGGTGMAIVQLGYHPKHMSVLVDTPLQNKEVTPYQINQLVTGIGQKNINYRAEYLHATLTTDSNEDSYIVMLDVPYDTSSF
ncbi:sensor histidine kinase [Spirosoma sp.]|uniref:ligand-binding sensor domain-containing protein n=1 Tax=Spirosoma sp. TaxID=1899569 RepID=UPI0026210BF9|nr:sensor histidine kinase [Spirosoma sp.]MCX6215663.1 triple tyrosine motif-containing protein [Spirosoma sp.]